MGRPGHGRSGAALACLTWLSSLAAIGLAATTAAAAIEKDTRSWQLRSTTGPANSASEQFGYAGGGRFILLAAPDPQRPNEQVTWEYDAAAGGRWTPLALDPAPSRRRLYKLAYDSRRKRAVLFGGVQALDGAALNDVWQYDGQLRQWREVTPRSGPAPVGFLAVAFDEKRDRFVTGGASPSATWEWDGSGWTEVPHSMRIYGGNLVYLPARERVIAIWTATAVYEWNGSDWLPLPVEPAPLPQHYPGFAYAGSGRVVAFGGYEEGPPPANSRVTWEFDGRRWWRMAPEGSPSARTRPLLAYDPDRDRVVLHGGHQVFFDTNNTPPVFFEDTWEYELSALDLGSPCAPERAERCASGSCVDGVCCVSACTAACERCNAEGQLGQCRPEVSAACPAPDAGGTSGAGGSAGTGAGGMSGAGGSAGTGAGGMSGSSGGGAGRAGSGGAGGDPATPGSIGASADASATVPAGTSRRYAGAACSIGPRRPGAVAPGARHAGVIPALGFLMLVASRVCRRRQLRASRFGAAWSMRRRTHARLGPALARVTWLALAALALASGTARAALEKDGRTWQLRSTTGPGQREFQRLSYAGSGRFIMLGPIDPGTPSRWTTWEYDVAGGRWSPLALGTLPFSFRQGHALAYDSRRQRVILFAGLVFTASDPDYKNEVWEYDGAVRRWHEATPAAGSAPQPRESPLWAFDERRNRFVMYGGQALEGGKTVYLDDTWEWNGTTWTEHHPATSITARELVYLPTRERVIAIGFGQVYEWDGGNWVATANSAPGVSGAHGFAYAGSGRVVAFGGSEGGPPAGDSGATWEFDGSRWWHVSPTRSPSARAEPLLAYDPDRDLAVVHGGWNLPGASAAARVNFTDTWEYQLSALDLGSPCTAKTAGRCGSGNCVDGICCASACTGTCERCNAAGQLGQCTREVSVDCRPHDAGGMPGAGGAAGQNGGGNPASSDAGVGGAGGGGGASGGGSAGASGSFDGATTPAGSIGPGPTDGAAEGGDSPTDPSAVRAGASRRYYAGSACSLAPRTPGVPASRAAKPGALPVLLLLLLVWALVGAHVRRVRPPRAAACGLLRVACAKPRLLGQPGAIERAQ
jgi:hypothetical protein